MAPFWYTRPKVCGNLFGPGIIFLVYTGQGFAVTIFCKFLRLQSKKAGPYMVRPDCLV